MPHLSTLAVIAGLTAVGATLGVSLGRASIAEINPAHFEDSGTPFYADLAPARPTGDWQQVQAQEYQAATQALPPAGCAGCTWPVDPAPLQDPAIARYDQPRASAPPPERIAPAARAAPIVRIAVEEQPAEPDWGGVERYSRYPVENSADPAADQAAGPAGDEGSSPTQ